MSEEIASGKYWTTIDCAENGGSVDLSKAAYLQMSVYNNSDASSATGWSLKARLTDRHGNVITRPASQMTYYGYSNSMPKGQWSIVRLNLADWNSGISDFDMKNVAKVQFAFARDRGSLYMADMDLKERSFRTNRPDFMQATIRFQIMNRWEQKSGLLAIMRRS